MLQNHNDMFHMYNINVEKSESPVSPRDRNRSSRTGRNWASSSLVALVSLLRSAAYCSDWGLQRGQFADATLVAVCWPILCHTRRILKNHITVTKGDYFRKQKLPVNLGATRQTKGLIQRIQVPNDGLVLVDHNAVHFEHVGAQKVLVAQFLVAHVAKVLWGSRCGANSATIDN